MHRHRPRPGAGAGVGRVLVDALAPRERFDHNLDLSARDGLASSSRPFLSPSEGIHSALDPYFSSVLLPRCLGWRLSLAQEVSLSLYRVVLVCWDACPGHRPGSGRVAGSCRSLHLFAPDWHLPSRHLGRGGNIRGPEVVSTYPERPRYRYYRDAHDRSLAANRILVRSGAIVGAYPRGYREQRCRGTRDWHRLTQGR